VFERIVRNAARLCQSVLSAVYRRDGEQVHLVAHDQFSPESVAAVRKAYPAPLTSENLISVALRERRVVHEPDVLVSGGYSELQRTSGYRSILIVPMLRNEVAIGAIAVMRLEPQLFPKAQVELLKTFAGQAVIAIENTRLFTEVQERTRQLSRSLEDLRAAQDSLVQTEKLAALGRLVAGVAHEINTPVGTSLTVASAFINRANRFEVDVGSGDVRRSILTEFIAASREAASQIMINLGHAADLIQSFKQVAADKVMAVDKGSQLNLFGKVAYARDEISNPALAANFTALGAGSSFTVFGARPSQNLLLSASGVEWRLANGISFMVKADSEYGEHSRTYSGTGRIRYTW
jgi:signal transduction histidine kinase